MSHLKPILQVSSHLKKLNEMTTEYAEKVVEEYMNNPAAPIHKYRPWAIDYEGTILFCWSRCDPQGRYWEVIESYLEKRVHSNSFRAASPSERKIITTTEQRLARTRELLIHLRSIKEAFKQFRAMNEDS